MNQLPDSNYVERVLAAIEKHPFGMLLLTIFAGVVGWSIHLWNN